MSRPEPAAASPRLATEPERRIYGFDTYEMPDGTWRAEYRRDQGLVLERATWSDLFTACVDAGIGRELRGIWTNWEERDAR